MLHTFSMLSLIHSFYTGGSLCVTDTPYIHMIRETWLSIFLDEVQLSTEVLRTPSSTRPGFELMTSRS